MIQAIRYVLVTVWFTAWYGARILLAAAAGIPQVPGGLFDQLQRGYGAAMMRGMGIELRVEGAEQLLAGEPVVFVSNHLSWVDIWVLLVGLPGVRFVFKKEISRVPLLGAAAHVTGHIELDRASRTSAFAAYDRAAGRVRQGTSALVFAEGTRSRTGRLLPFKKGPFVLAIAAQVPVVPVVCVGTYELMPPGRFAPTSGRVVVRIGRPIVTAGLSSEARDEVADRARRTMLDLGAVE